MTQPTSADPVVTPPDVEVAPADLSVEAAYRLFTGIIVPRPIAWVTTLAPNGGINLAPFSHFVFLSPQPPMIGISVGKKGEIYKDTGRNILANEEFVVNIADIDHVEAVHHSAVEYPPDVSEVDELGIATEASRYVSPPRVSSAPISLECRLTHCIAFGVRQTRLMVGEVVNIVIRNGLLQDGKIQTDELKPLARVAGPNYATLGELIAMRPIFRTPKP